MALTLTLTEPVFFFRFPRIAPQSELFPEPTGPTTATSDPGVTFRSIFDRVSVAVSSSSQANEPFSIDTAYSVQDIYIMIMLKIVFFIEKICIKQKMFQVKITNLFILNYIDVNLIQFQ